MDYWRPKTYPSPTERFSVGDCLGGLLLIVAFIAMLAVLAMAQVVPQLKKMTRGDGHG